MSRSRIVGLITLAVTIALLPAAAMAANEGVCNGLEDATPGLYGLCIAFCEAQDCEPDWGAADPFAGCTPASNGLLDLYNDRKQPGDPDMPCIQTSTDCPCFTPEQIAAIPTPYDQCIVDYDFGSNGGELHTNIIYDVETNGTGAEAILYPGQNFGYCVYGNGLVDPPIFVFFQTTVSQAQTCRQILVDQIESDPGQCELLCDPVCN